MRAILLLMMICFLPIESFAQNKRDSVVFKNEKYLVGEIKSMDKGVLQMKTPFSKEDFKIKWLEIEAIYSEELFLIGIKEGSRLYGKISSPKIGRLQVDTDNELDFSFPVEDIIYIKSQEEGILHRFNAAIDLGFTLTRARNQRQFTVRSRFGYISRKWSFNASFNKLSTIQDEVDEISRGDGNFTSVYSLGNDWLSVARYDYLYNTEQLLDLRSNLALGMGRYFVRSNLMTWTVLGGGSYNVENFTGEVDSRRSIEAWVGSELNLFNMGDINLLTNILIYPSLTERNRLRIDYKIDLKYDLPLDFYIKTGLTLNFDNQAVAGASRSDYVWQTSFGWSW